MIKKASYLLTYLRNLSDAVVEQQTTATCDTTDYESDSCPGTESEASKESESDVDLCYLFLR